MIDCGRKLRRTAALAVLWLLVGVWPAAVQAQIYDYPGQAPRETAGPPNLPAPARELLIDSALDIAAVEPLIRGFQAIHPDVSVRYRDLDTSILYETFLEAADAGRPVADLLLSSAMDQQIKLVNDGYALSHRSAATDALPRWAVWRNEAFGFTFEPVVIVYNRRLVPAEDVPRSRWELVRLLRAQPERYLGRIATYDPERSGVGFLFVTQDSKQSPVIWEVARAMGASGVKLFSNTAAILDRIAAGNFLLGYNLLGSYAKARADHDPDIGIVLPEDYTLVISRIAVIPKAAPHPETARSFLDFLVSEPGQRIIAGASTLYSIHPAVEGPATAKTLEAAATGPLRPIQVGPGLLVYLDEVKRRKFLRQWQQALGGR